MPEKKARTSIREISSELDNIVRSRQFTRRLPQVRSGHSSQLITTINSLLDSVQEREAKLQNQVRELKIAWDDAQTANKLLRMVKNELKARKLQLDEAISKTEAASTAKSQFLANMSHEIRTPMNGILGTAELISRTDLNPKQKKYVTTIIKSGRALLTIINDILDFSKVESGKFDLDNRPFDVAMCVNDVAALLKPSSSRKNVSLSVELPQDLPKWYIGDVGRLRQILTNIVGNSVKFTDKGEVRIRLTSETDDGRNVLRFEIIDTGIGIPENKINDVFEKFSQVDNTSARRYEGTGLGLAICRTLVERMDGKIGLMSKVGVGSTFWFTLPLKPHILAPSAPNSSVSINALPVLLFEAEGGEYSPWLISLRNIGCNVDLVTSVEALPRVVMSKAGGGSAVVLFSIPVSSETLLRQVAELRARVGSNVAIVVCTSLGVTGDSKSLVAAGAQAYLSGELTDEQLRDVLTDVVSNLQSATHQLVTRHSITEHRASPESIDDGTGAIDLDRDTCEARSVLLVEDSMTNQEVARDFLESMGCLVDVAHNGKEAVEATQVTRYAIVLMDCQMPVMDGFQATRAIREHEEKNGTDRIPIIALTANAFESDKEKCAAAGMSDFLSKPFMPDEFETVVLKWMAVARRRIGRKKLDILADA